MLAVALVLALGGASGCGGGGAGAGGSEGVAATTSTEAAATNPLDGDPCGLLSEKRIAELFGTKVKGRYEEGDDANVCGYRSGRAAEADASPPVPTGIDVFLGVPYFVELSEELARQSGVEPVTELPGIGDSAYLSGNQAAAVKGDAAIMVATLGLAPSDPAVEELLSELLAEAVAAYP